MARILVTGAGGSAAHNFTEALRLTGAHSVVGADAHPALLELAEVDARYLVPRVHEDGYLDAVNRIVERERIDVVHPQPDVEVAHLARHGDRVAARTFLPDAAVVDLCQDKLAFNTVMAEQGVPAPEARHIDSPESLERALQRLLEIQPRVWLRAIRGAGSRGSLPISNVRQGQGWIDYWRTFRGLDYGDFMASEFLPGREFAWQSLWWDGELVTAQARERIEYVFGNLTPSGQTSSPSVARTVNRDDVDEIGQASVRAASGRPHGVFCVDMKEDAGGAPKVTEINAGRFFTTSNFFAHAGLNMPAMYVELALTGSLVRRPQQLQALPDDLYWVRMIDMGHRLVEGGRWSSIHP